MGCSQYYQRYRRHRDRAELSEETVKLLLVFPLLELAEFYDEPFFVTAEAPVQIEIQDTHEILKGRIDILIIHQEIWILIVESKRSVALTAAIPQCLALYVRKSSTLSTALWTGDRWRLIYVC